MTDIDIVAELRRLYAAAPQGKWTLEPYADFAGRVIGYDIQQIGPNGGDVIEVAKREDADLIVAMHEALPALLDAVEALRGLRRYPANTVSAEVYEMRLDAALAALKRSDEG